MNYRKYIDLVEASDKSLTLTTEKLPYAKNALAPVLSQESLVYHYDHLARGYAQRYNSGEGDREFNHAGSYLHNLFFPQLQPPAAGNRPQGRSLELINQKFGSWDQFRSEIEATAMAIQGSGWVYLSDSGVIKVIKNHQIKKDIVLLIDWWEHAWALDYQHDKAKYLKNFWRIVNWSVVNHRLEGK